MHGYGTLLINSDTKVKWLTAQCIALAFWGPVGVSSKDKTVTKNFTHNSMAKSFVSSSVKKLQYCELQLIILFIYYIVEGLFGFLLFNLQNSDD